MKPNRIASTAIAAALLITAALLAPPADAGSTLERIRSAKTLRVGITGTQPPLNAKNKAGNIIGFEADLARMLGASMGVKTELVATPFAELLPKVAKGELDIVISGLTMTPERNLDVAFVGPYFVSGKSILSDEHTLADLQDAREINKPDMKLVALKDSTSQIFAEEIIPKAQLTTVASYAAGVKMVKDGTADVLIADHPFCMVAVLQDEGETLVTLAEPFTFEPIGMALPPDDALFVNLVTNFLTMIEGTGTLLEMKESYFADGEWLADVQQ